MLRRERLRTGMTAGGRLVHFLRADRGLLCKPDAGVGHPVHARITCRACAARRPDKARRLARRPHVVALNWEPYYAALRRALDAGATKEPPVRVPYWPVLAS